MAREQFDIALDANLKPIAQGGDFLIVESTERHQQLLLLYEPGNLKSDPTAGVGIGSHIENDTDEVEVERDIEREFRADGMTVRELRIDSLLDVKINAFYK